jgi:organic hydroperoxide reductase OsmC/OhrA
MLWYLHLCAVAGVVVVGYTDTAKGVMQETTDGGGHFSSVTLCPHVVVKEAAMIQKAINLHKEANRFCFIANSCNFPISHIPVVTSITGEETA